MTSCASWARRPGARLVSGVLSVTADHATLGNGALRCANDATAIATLRRFLSTYVPAERIAADGLVTFSYDIEPSFADADYAYISGIIVIAPFLLPGFRPC